MKIVKIAIQKLTMINKWVAFWTLVLMMAFVTVFSIARLLGHPIVGDVELVQFGMVLTIMGSLSYTQSSDSHISVGIIVDRFPRKVQFIIDIISSLTILIFCVLIAWIFIAKLNTNQTSSLLKIPFWPFKLFLIIGLLGWGLEAVLSTFRTIGKIKMN